MTDMTDMCECVTKIVTYMFIRVWTIIIYRKNLFKYKLLIINLIIITILGDNILNSVNKYTQIDFFREWVP